MTPISLAEIKKTSKTSVIGAYVADAEHHPLLARRLPPPPSLADVSGGDRDGVGLGQADAEEE